MQGLHAGALVGWLVACSGQDPSGAPLIHDVGATFSTCAENEIRFLAAKHDVRLAFEPCGNNEIPRFAWSPDGTKLYFQLVLSSWVMAADQPGRDLHPIPAPLPVGQPAWVGPRRLALPLAPDGGGARIAVYDVPELAAGAVRLVELSGVVELRELHPDEAADSVIAMARTGEGWGLHRVRLADGVVTSAFDGRLGAPDTFSWSPRLGLAVVGRGTRVELVDVHTGVVRESWEHATRGLLSVNGDAVVLEGPGDPISLYFQRTWEELPPAARERELVRARRMEEQLPAWAPREVSPPALQIVDRVLERRWTVTAFAGDRTQWYDAAPGWVSFGLWGFEGKQLKPNVALVNLLQRLPGEGETPPEWGIEAWHPPRSTVDAAMPHQAGRP